MAAAAPAVQASEADAAEAPAPAKASGRRRLLLLAIPLVVAAVVAGLWFAGILPRLLGLHHPPKADTAAAAVPIVPIYVDVPELVANLNSDPRRPGFVKLNARLEVSEQKDADRVRQVMPRIQDLFQTYLREMHPQELRGSAGSYRLREELLARANIAAAPAHIRSVLFVQMLIQ
jgi:flagellar FliL protein